MWLVMICSISLQAMQVREMGQSLAALYFSPFLKTGVMLACFQSFGRVPEKYEMP